jgi:hypothetical protein
LRKWQKNQGNKKWKLEKRRKKEMNGTLERSIEEKLKRGGSIFTPLSENPFFEGVYRQHHCDSVEKGVFDSKNLFLYSYGHQNPVRYLDPDGNICVTAGLEISGGLFGFGGLLNISGDFAFDIDTGWLSSAATFTYGGGAAAVVKPAASGGASFTVSNATDVKQMYDTFVNGSKGLGPVTLSGYTGNAKDGKNIKGGGVTVGFGSGSNSGIVTNTVPIPGTSANIKVTDRSKNTTITKDVPKNLHGAGGSW